MSGASSEYIEDAHGRKVFLVAVEGPVDSGEFWFEADVEVVTAWDADGDPAEHEAYLHCVIKWDSCAHIRFGEPDGNGRDGYLHLCGVEDFKRHALLMEALYRLAFQRMGREPEDGEQW